MTHRILTFIAALTVASSAGGQAPPADAALSNFLRASYAALSRDLVAAVEIMPAEEFGFRPAGAVKEVRTFGEIVSHLVLVNMFVCAMGDGQPDTTSAKSVSIIDKPGLVALLNETNARCTAYLATLTDSALPQVVTKGSGDRAMQSVRGNAVMFAIAHSNEHYGNLVTYLRAKGLVPPPKPAQAAFLSPVSPRAP